MKKSTLILLVVFAVLGSITAYVLAGKGENESTLVDNWDGNFKVENIDEVHRIFIADRTGGTSNLERTGDHWIYDGKHRAHPNVMKNLLEAIEKVEIRYIPPKAAIEPMVKDIATNGLKVQLFNKAGDEIKTYYVGGTTPDALGTFMIMEGSEQPYVTQIPSMEGSLNVRYGIKGDKWREKILFQYEAEKIDFLSVEYPKQRNKSFILEKKNGQYEVRPFYDITATINKPVLEGKVLAYLDNFDLMYFTAYENDNQYREDFEQNRIPFAIMKIKYDGKEREIVLHPAKSTNVEKPVEVTEYYLAELEPGNDFVLIAHETIKKVLWAYEFFFD